MRPFQVDIQALDPRATFHTFTLFLLWVSSSFADVIAWFSGGPFPRKCLCDTVGLHVCFGRRISRFCRPLRPLKFSHHSVFSCTGQLCVDIVKVLPHLHTLGHGFFKRLTPTGTPFLVVMVLGLARFGAAGPLGFTARLNEKNLDRDFDTGFTGTSWSSSLPTTLALSDESDNLADSSACGNHVPSLSLSSFSLLSDGSVSSLTGLRKCRCCSQIFCSTKLKGGDPPTSASSTGQLKQQRITNTIIYMHH